MTISLWYGSPHQRRIPVATIVPRDGVTARVDELRAFGVQPVEISIETRQRHCCTFQSLGRHRPECR